MNADVCSQGSLTVKSDAQRSHVNGPRIMLAQLVCPLGTSSGLSAPNPGSYSIFLVWRSLLEKHCVELLPEAPRME